MSQSSGSPAGQSAAASSQPLSVLGLGLTSPYGTTPRDHAFFIRGRLRPTMPSPYIDAEGNQVPAHYCRWLGAELGCRARMERMALTALGTAAEPFLGHFESGWDVVLVVESPRPGLDEAAVMGVRSAAQTLFAGKRAKISLEYGAAGCQRALISLAARLNAGESKVGCLLAVDSFMSVLALADDHRPPVVWRPQENPLSEAAAALVVTADVGIPQGLVPVGRILHNAVRYGIPSDLNDEIVDGHALTRILHAIPDMGRPIPAVFGPTGVDPLRLREWLCASVRIARRLCEPYASHDLESQIGRIGAASGLAHLVYGLTCLRHRVAHPELNKGVLALGWTISRDGQRGVTLFEGGVP